MPCEKAYAEKKEIWDGDCGKRITRWYIEINSLDELIALSKECGELIVECGDENKLEIYDAYREL